MHQSNLSFLTELLHKCRSNSNFVEVGLLVITPQLWLQCCRSERNVRPEMDEQTGIYNNKIPYFIFHNTKIRQIFRKYHIFQAIFFWSRFQSSDNVTRLGVAVLKQFDVFPEEKWYWIGIAALLGFTVLFNILFLIALTYLNCKFHWFHWAFHVLIF